jgi:hypothetical protein
MVWGALISAALLSRALAALAAAGPPPAGGYWPGLPDATPFCLLTAAVALHMPFSVGFHLFRGMRPDVYNLWRRLDQVFIFQARGLQGRAGVGARWASTAAPWEAAQPAPRAAPRRV